MVLGTDRHARSRLPRRTVMAPLAGDNTIGWQDKQAYRAKLTIARAAVKQVQRQEVKETLQKKDEARQRRPRCSQRQASCSTQPIFCIRNAHYGVASRRRRAVDGGIFRNGQRRH